MHDICFNWDEFPHGNSVRYGGEEYSLDFSSSPPRPFKHTYNMTLYRGGPLELKGCPYRDPALANILEMKFGFDYRLLSACGDVVFYSDAWEPVRKGSIVIPAMLLLDHEHRVALAPHWTESIIYYSRHAWPTGGAKIKARIPNRQRAKDLKRVLHDAIALGYTYFAMDGPHNRGGIGIDDFMAGFLAGEIDITTLTPDKNSLALWQLGRYVANRQIDSKINYWAEKPIEVTQLRFKQK